MTLREAQRGRWPASA